MKKVISILALAAVCAVAAGSFYLGAKPQEVADWSADVVELYTSENCKLCPQAEADFLELVEMPGIFGVALHVDYSRPPMKPDPYALDAALDRQTAYVRKLGEDILFTPMFVVNGVPMPAGTTAEEIWKNGFVGAGPGHSPLEAVARGDTLYVDILDNIGFATATVMVTEDGVENGSVYRGSKKTHSRVLRHVEDLAIDGPAIEVPLDDAWVVGKLRVLVIVQEGDRFALAEQKRVAVE